MALNLSNVPEDFDLKHKFIVEIGQFLRAGFTTCSEIKVSRANIEYNEGGRDIPVKLVGRATVADVTLTRGVTRDEDAYEWFKEVSDLASNTGLVSPFFKKDIDVVQLNSKGFEVKRWTLINAFPGEFVAGDWSNDEDGVVMEQLILRYDYPKQPRD